MVVVAAMEVEVEDVEEAVVDMEEVVVEADGEEQIAFLAEKYYFKHSFYSIIFSVTVKSS